MNDTTLITMLRLDAAFNLAGGAALLAAAGWLAPPVGIQTAWPLRLLAVALLVNGVEILVVSRRRTGGGLAALAAADLGFAAGVLALATVDPTGAAGWVRWTLAALGVMSIAMALVKLADRRQPAPPQVATPLAHR
jgi:hypothetical protein